MLERTTTRVLPVVEPRRRPRSGRSGVLRCLPNLRDHEHLWPRARRDRLRRAQAAASFRQSLLAAARERERVRRRLDQHRAVRRRQADLDVEVRAGERAEQRREPGRRGRAEVDVDGEGAEEAVLPTRRDAHRAGADRLRELGGVGGREGGAAAARAAAPRRAGRRGTSSRRARPARTRRPGPGLSEPQGARFGDSTQSSTRARSSRLVPGTASTAEPSWSTCARPSSYALPSRSTNARSPVESNVSDVRRGAVDAGVGEPGDRERPRPRQRERPGELDALGLPGDPARRQQERGLEVAAADPAQAPERPVQQRVPVGAAAAAAGGEEQRRASAAARRPTRRKVARQGTSDRRRSFST